MPNGCPPGPRRGPGRERKGCRPRGTGGRPRWARTSLMTSTPRSRSCFSCKRSWSVLAAVLFNTLVDVTFPERVRQGENGFLLGCSVRVAPGVSRVFFEFVARSDPYALPVVSVPGSVSLVVASLREVAIVLC